MGAMMTQNYDCQRKLELSIHHIKYLGAAHREKRKDWRALSYIGGNLLADAEGCY